MSTGSALRRLVGDVDRFRSEVWGRRPIHVRARSDERFTDLLTIDSVDELITGAARLPTVRMVVDGETIPAAQYCSLVRLGGRDVDDVADPAKVVDRLADGATLVLQSLHRTNPAVATFVRDLRDEISHPVQANAYLTPPTAAGLAEHADVHDVIAVQLDGTKRWWVEGLGEVTVGPGDVMYVPRGARHRAETGTETSLHLTIGITRVTYRQVIERLLREQPSLLDEPLPVGYRHASETDDLAQGIDGALEYVLDRVGSADLDEVVTRERTRRHAVLPAPGRIASMARVDRLRSDQSIRWTAQEPLARAIDRADRRLCHWDGLRDHPLWSDEPERVIVDYGDRRLNLPSTTLPALRCLSQGRPVRVIDLPGLDEASRLVLAKRLVREAACVVESPVE